MANNTMQILRSNTTATPGSLANGQLAYTSNGDILYIGSPATSTPVIPIGGKMYPGTLTANLALVANSTSGLNNIIVGTLTLQGNATTNGSISANGSVGTGGQVLLSGGATSNTYWGSGGAATPAGTTTMVQFNLTGALAANAGFTYTPSTNTVAIANSITVGTFTANSTLANVAAINVIGQVNTATFEATTSANVGANIQITTSALTIAGNTTTAPSIWLTSNSTNSAFSFGNSTITGAPQIIVANTLGQVTINTGIISVGANIYANTLGFFAGNSTVNTIVNSTIYVSGNSTVYTTGNSSSDFWVGVNTNSSINAGALFIGNSTVNTTVNSSTFTGNTLTLTTALGAAYGGTGQLGGFTAGDVLYASGASALSKLSVPGTVANGQVLQIASNLPAWGVLDGGSF